MTDRSVPFTLGTGTSIRYDRADIKAIENALGIGYPHFTREGIFGSLTATEVFTWRGMRQENEKGELVHTFPLTDAGKDTAGDLVMDYLQAGGSAHELNTAIIDGFCACGLFSRRASSEPKPEKDSEDTPKNSPT